MKAAGQAGLMKKSSNKKPGQQNKRPQKKSLFERNPKKTLILTVLFLFLILDGLAGAVLNPRADSSFRCSNPYYHHDFLPNRNVETAWGPHRYRVITNSLGFRDGAVREIPLSSKQRRILLIGDSYIEGMGVPYENSVAGILAEFLKASAVEVLNASSVSYSPKLYFLKTRYLIEQKHLAFDELYVFIDISDPHDEILYKYWDPESAFASGLRALNSFLRRHSFFYGYGAARRRLSSEKVINNAFPAESSAEARFWIQDLEEYLKRPAPEKDRFLWPNKKSALEEWGREGLSLCEQYMTELVKLCNGRGIRLTLVIYPSPYQLTSDNLEGIQVTFWQRFAEKNRTGFLNLFPAFISGDPPETVYARYFIQGDGHWNEAGNRHVAEAVLQYMQRGLRQVDRTQP